MKTLIENIKSSEYANRMYWLEKKPNDIMYPIKLLKQYSESDNKILFLQEQLIEYPDAPDLLNLLAREFRNIGENKKALELYHKILEVYPNLTLIKTSLKMTEVLLLSESMPETPETIQWAKNKINEICNSYNN